MSSRTGNTRNSAKRRRLGSWKARTLARKGLNVQRPTFNVQRRSSRVWSPVVWRSVFDARGFDSGVGSERTNFTPKHRLLPFHFCPTKGATFNVERWTLDVERSSCPASQPPSLPASEHISVTKRDAIGSAGTASWSAGLLPRIVTLEISQTPQLTEKPT